jgi:hypothetical protein
MPPPMPCGTLFAPPNFGQGRGSRTQRYAHLADDPLREAADRVTSAIAKAGQGGKVVKLRGDR